jgi:Polyketide cyclase / dehydrase and lipid transport
VNVWFDVDPCGLDFCERSPHRIVNEAVLAVDPARAFELIASDRELGAWLHDFVACRWTSDPPHGVGSTREVTLKALCVQERFIAWDPGERLTFAITASTLPLMHRAVEDLQLTKVGPAKTLLRWTVHYDLRPWVRPFHVLPRAVFRGLFAQSAKNIARYAAEHG